MPFKDKGSKGQTRWRGQVKFDGRAYRKDFRTKKEAAQWELKKQQELKETHTATTSTDMDLASFCNRYLDHARLRFVPKTYDNKRRLCRRLLMYLGDISVNEVTPELIEDYLTHQAGTRSTSRYNEDYKQLRAMWTWGVDILDLPRNPVGKIKRIPHERRPQYTPSTKDILRVIAAATREERVFLNCYLQTAARKSEIFRWTWNDDINFERRQIRLGTRKTIDGSMDYEWLPMSDELYEELWWWWNNCPIRDTPYVFVCTSNRHYGKPYTTRHRFLPGLCKRAGVKPFGFHAMRRYVASILADKHKVSAKTIQRILRHKSLATTERYIHNVHRDLKDTMNLLSEKGPHAGSPQNEQGVSNDS